MQKLKYTFGDDGMFYMSFDDMLNNFETVARTRLFDERWIVSHQWTSTPVSWLRGSLKKRFTLDIKQRGEVVIVLSQLDRGYFSGVQGEYVFDLNFILTEAGSDEPIRTIETEVGFGFRSISCEIDLKPERYEVVPKIVALKDGAMVSVEYMVKKWASRNPSKVQQVAAQYDIAHAKAGIINEDDEILKRQKASRKKRTKRTSALKKAEDTSHEGDPAGPSLPRPSESGDKNNIDEACDPDAKLKNSESEDDSDSDRECLCVKDWNAVCVIGLRVYSQHSGVEIGVSKGK